MKAKQNLMPTYNQRLLKDTKDKHQPKEAKADSKVMKWVKHYYIKGSFWSIFCSLMSSFGISSAILKPTIS